MKKILITGALGQDGRILSKIFLKKNFKVFGLIEKNKNKSKYKIKKIKYICNNLINHKKVEKIILYLNPDIIIHLAAKNESNQKNNQNLYKKYYKNNLLMTKNLINGIINRKKKIKFIFAGSSMMFDGQNDKIINERQKFISKSFYGKYKIDTHNFLMEMKKLHKIFATTVILFNHDSEYRSKKFLFPRIIKAFIQKNLIFLNKIYQKNIIGDFSHAADICNGISLVALSKINLDKVILSSGKLTKINDIIDFLNKKFKLNYKFIKIGNNKTSNQKGSNALAKKIFKWSIKKNIYAACLDIKKNQLNLY